jgi:type IV secretory pathway VirB10-like protein
LNATGSDLWRQGVASSLSQSSANILDHFINVPPTLTTREGHRVKVYLMRDLLLPAYENHSIPPYI